MPSPFKNALFWPKCDENRPKKRKPKLKRTPTVAISDDFIEYQRRLDNEKKRKIEEQLKRKEKRLIQKVSMKNLEQREESDNSETVDDENLMPETLDETPKTAADENWRLNLKSGDFVVVTYEGELYPGCVLENIEEGYKIKTMDMCGGGSLYWKWPEKDDILIYSHDDIITQIPSPELMNSRGQYSVSKIRTLLCSQKSVLRPFHRKRNHAS